MEQPFKNKRVFVSGGAGVIGQELVAALLEQGAEIYVGDLKPCPEGFIGKLRYRQGDLITLSQREIDTFSPHYFFHLAATFERSEETLEFFSQNAHHNVALSHHLLSLLCHSESLEKIIFASSYLIYDPKLYLFAQPQQQALSLSEESAINPRNLCGVAKLLHEKELLFFRHFPIAKFKAVCARIFRVYGKNSRDVISRWILAASSGEAIDVFCKEGLFDYIYAKDVAYGLMALGASDAEGVVNLGSGRSRSVEEVVTILKSHFPSLAINYSEKAMAYEASQACMKKFASLTQWCPEYSLEKGIATLVAEKRSQVTSSLCSANVLISSVGKKVPMVRAVKAALNKREEGSLVFGADASDKCLGRYFVDSFWHCPRDDELSSDALIRYCKAHNICCIFPSRDQELLFFAKHKEDLKACGIYPMVSSLKTIETCLDKLLFAKFLEEHGFPCIPTTEQLEDRNMALVVKERFGAGGRNIGINLSYDEAKKCAEGLKSPLFQPFIQGKEWSVDLYISTKRQVVGAIARQRDLVVDGESQVTTTAEFPMLEELCASLALALGIEGHAIFQAIEGSDGKIFFIECNPRFGGASTLSLAAGLDSFYWFLLESSGYVDKSNLQFYRIKEPLRQVRAPCDAILAV
jgi:carbamoyl-phosphate synthase large subunit